MGFFTANPTFKTSSNLNRFVETRNALGGVTKYSYDNIGNRILSENELGHKKTYVFDELNREKLVIDSLGNTRSRIYDLIGNIISKTDEMGRTEKYVYDALNRQVSRIDSLGYSFNSYYDEIGNLTSQTDELGNRTNFVYDDFNRLISEIDPLGHTTDYQYDANGNLAKVSDLLGQSKTYVYDAADRLVKAIDELGGTNLKYYDSVGNLVSQIDELGRVTKYEYDELNRKVKQISPLGDKTIFTYDSVGNLISQVDALGQVSNYGYDSLNRRIFEADASGATTEYMYDENGNVIALIDPLGNQNSYTYDSLNRLVKDTNSLGYSRTYNYDAVGNLTSQTDRNNQKRIFEYDDRDLQISEIWLDSGDKEIQKTSYRFDEAKRLQNVTDGTSSYTYSYDAASRLESVDNLGTLGVPNVVIEYTYDSRNNLVGVTDIVNNQVQGVKSFVRNSLNRVTQIIQSGDGVIDKRVDVSYNSAQEKTSITRYSDIEGSQSVADSVYTYDGAGRLTGLTHTQNDNIVADYEWSYDAIDRAIDFTSVDGVVDYSYSSNSQLTHADYSYQEDELYSYDDNGNREGNGYVVGSDNRLLNDGKYLYSYDNEGNLIQKIDVVTDEVISYIWDYRNRLTQVTTEDNEGNVTQTVDFTYDPNNRRIAKSVSGNVGSLENARVERFIYDGDHVSFVLNEDGEVTERFLHAPGIDQVISQEDSQGQVFWSLTDNVGSVRDVVSSNGSVLNHITYDSFGKLKGQTNPEIDFRFGYTGREYDEDIQLQYNRARFYDPSVGKFISIDPIGFESGDTNLYRYVRNNPIVFADPWGEQQVPQEILDAALDVNPEEARRRLRLISLSGAVTGFANDMLQYALDEADTAPWGVHPQIPDLPIRIAPPRFFDSDSDIAKVIIRSDQFRDPIQSDIDSLVQQHSTALGVGQSMIFPLSDSYPLNYRDDRNSLKTFRLSVALGYVPEFSYNGDLEIVKVNCNLVLYEANIEGEAGDFYDFNNPQNLQDPFTWPARLAFIALEGGTLAGYNVSIDVSSYFSGEHRL